ncbi:MAG: hypothetical protein AAB850_01370 [Patescibacteria group bacterium]
MKTIFEHIEHIKGKPHHVRKRVAFAAAAGGAGAIALVWLVSSLGTGAFAIRGATFSESTGQESPATAGVGDNFQNVAGAAAVLEDGSTPAYIEIIDSASSTLKAKQAEQTTIPF